MNAIQAIQATAATSDTILKSYVGDLEDADLMRRPHAECNHLAWQLGHLISSQCMLTNMLKPGSAAELPEGFAEAYSRDNPCSDDPMGYHTKAEYLELYDRVRAASAATLETLSEADLDAPNPNEQMRPMFPTAGAMWVLMASHPMMHVGQFVPVRREAGKPIVI